MAKKRATHESPIELVSDSEDGGDHKGSPQDPVILSDDDELLVNKPTPRRSPRKHGNNPSKSPSRSGKPHSTGKLLGAPKQVKAERAKEDRRVGASKALSDYDDDDFVVNKPVRRRGIDHLAEKRKVAVKPKPKPQEQYQSIMKSPLSKISKQIRVSRGHQQDFGEDNMR